MVAVAVAVAGAGAGAGFPASICLGNADCMLALVFVWHLCAQSMVSSLRAADLSALKTRLSEAQTRGLLAVKDIEMLQHGKIPRLTWSFSPLLSLFVNTCVDQCVYLHYGNAWNNLNILCECSFTLMARLKLV